MRKIVLRPEFALEMKYNGFPSKNQGAERRIDGTFAHRRTLFCRPEAESPAYEQGDVHAEPGDLISLHDVFHTT